MRASIIIGPVLVLALSACNSAEQAEPEKLVEKAAESSGVSDVYIRIRKLAAVGELDAASKLTDDPAAYLSKMTTAMGAIGDARFQENMKNAAIASNILDEKKSGDFAMLIVKYSFKGVNEKAANFFRKSGDNYVEIVNADDSIPCQLVRDFHTATGDKDAEIGNCTETLEAMPAG